MLLMQSVRLCAPLYGGLDGDTYLVVPVFSPKYIEELDRCGGTLVRSFGKYECDSLVTNSDRDKVQRGRKRTEARDEMFRHSMRLTALCVGDVENVLQSHIMRLGNGSKVCGSDV